LQKTSFFSRQAALRRVTANLLVLTSIGALGVGSLGGVAAGLAYFQLFVRQGTSFDLTELRAVVIFGVTITLGITVLVIAGQLLLLHFSRSAPRRFFNGRELRDEAEDKWSDEDRRTLNVVQEMSIAALLPEPRLLVLEEDSSVNSFAIAPRSGQAIIGVTAGARDRLTRDELQAIVAHELAHIANGDAAINVRLLALIQGFRWLYDMSVTVIGWPLRTFRSFKVGFMLTFYLTMVFGVFFVIGLFGVGVARLMQAAIARRREYLADASAVQFTRDTSGLVGALRKADDYRPDRRHGPTKKAAFMMFVSPYRARSWLLRTHPKIEDRIEAGQAMTPGPTLDSITLEAAQKA